MDNDFIMTLPNSTSTSPAAAGSSSIIGNANDFLRDVLANMDNFFFSSSVGNDLNLDNDNERKSSSPKSTQGSRREKQDDAKQLKQQGGEEEYSPVNIVSIVFVEFDNSGYLNVLNMNGTYVSTDLADGAVIEFPSISKTQRSDIPGGVAMLLVGVDDEGGMVRNRLAWTYDEDCDGSISPIVVGDAIGWVEIVSVCYIAM